MWQEKLQDTAASHPWLEPHEAIKRKTQPYRTLMMASTMNTVMIYPGG